MITSWGCDVKPFAFTPISFFQWSNRRTHTTGRREQERFRWWCGLPFTHQAYHGLGGALIKLINGLIAAASSLVTCVQTSLFSRFFLREGGRLYTGWQWLVALSYPSLLLTRKDVNIYQEDASVVLSSTINFIHLSC